MAREHEDNVVPVSAAGAVDGSEFSEPEESDDYMCCECGGWTRANEVIDETIIDPWGYALRELTQSTVAHARRWLAAEAGPAGDGWAWHPVQVEVRRDFRAVLAACGVAGRCVWGVLGGMGA
jgi:hypothetical protein